MKLALLNLALLICCLKGTECSSLPDGNNGRAKPSSELQDELTSAYNFTCPYPNGSFPADRYACESYYYFCVDDNPYLMDCPGDTIFDPSIRMCLPFEDTSCSKISTTTTPETTPYHPPTYPTTSIPERCHEDGLYPKPNICHQFILCSNGIAYTMSCPADLYFDPVKLYCNYKWLVPCK